MKKAIIFIIVLILSVSLIACGAKGGDEFKKDGEVVPEVPGIVQEVNPMGGTVLVDSTAEYVSGLIWVSIDEDTYFFEGVSEEFFVGNYVEFVVKGGIMESYPMQGYADAVYRNEAR